MITAVDTNIVLDVLLQDEVYGPQSREWLRAAYGQGSIVVSDIVYAELAPAVEDRDMLDDSLRALDVEVSPIDAAIAWEAGVRWGRYRRAGGPRQRILADFLIGAHASAMADALLTRDQRFFSNYFPELDTPVSG